MKFIEIKNGSQNNLKNISVKIPLGQITVVCGLSGSGKSSLAFETLYAEGQRRYLENLSNYVKQYVSRQAKPQVEEIENLPPAMALEQKNKVRSSRSLVATASGLSDHLRLLFEKMGKVVCEKHKVPLKEFSPHSTVKFLMENFSREKALISVPVERKLIESSGEFLSFLRKEGFSRLFVLKKEKFNFSSLEIKQLEELKTLPSKDFFILIDRLVIEEEGRDRLLDSLEQAFKIPSLYGEKTGLPGGAAVACGTEGMHWFSEKKKCPRCRYQFPLPLTASLFSFNSPLGACPACKGAGIRLETNESKVVPRPKLSLEQGAILPFTMPSAWSWEKQLRDFCRREAIPWNKPWCNIPLHQRQRIWEGEGSWLGVEGYFKTLEAKKYKMHIRVFLARFRSVVTCSKCQGTRFRKEVNSVFLKEKTFSDYMKMNLEELEKFFKKNPFTPQETKDYGESIERLKQNLKSLNSLGLSYLNLNRPVSTLSGGEFQRLNLSNQMGMGLSQMLYVLDEPTVGLHPRDTHCMLEALGKLKDLGNTIVVVEHDQEIIEKGDFIVEMGPGAGHKGGKVIWSGARRNFKEIPSSNTLPWLEGQSRVKDLPRRKVDMKTHKFILNLKGCSGHNLKNLDLKLPLNRFVVVTGVSGSGKSSLISQTLYPALQEKLKKEPPIPPLKHRNLSGEGFLKDVLLLSQSDLRQTLRSSPASYMGIYSLIRFLFATEPFAVKKNFTASHFSLNVEKGRCPVCKGLGFQGNRHGFHGSYFHCL